MPHLPPPHEQGHWQERVGGLGLGANPHLVLHRERGLLEDARDGGKGGRSLHLAIACRPTNVASNGSATKRRTSDRNGILLALSSCCSTISYSRPAIRRETSTAGPYTTSAATAACTSRLKRGSSSADGFFSSAPTPAFPLTPLRRPDQGRELMTGAHKLADIGIAALQQLLTQVFFEDDACEHRRREPNVF